MRRTWSVTGDVCHRTLKGCKPEITKKAAPHLIEGDIAGPYYRKRYGGKNFEGQPISEFGGSIVGLQ